MAHPVPVLVTAAPLTSAQRADLAWREARSAATEHTNDLLDAVETSRRLAAEIAEGSDAYPPALRDLARRLEAHLRVQLNTMEAVTRSRL